MPFYGVLCIDRARLRGLGAMPASIGGEEVELLNDSHFEKIRNACGVKLSDLTPDLFKFTSLEKGGGKGGSLMQFTNDGRLLVKQLSGDDHKSLELHFAGYCTRVVEDGGESVIARFFFHFKRPADNKHYVVMNSLFPSESLDTVWDLKGCADDKIMREHGKSVAQVHKRWFMLHWLVSEATCGCLLPLERREYKAGKTRARTEKFALNPEDFSAFMKSVRKDSISFALIILNSKPQILNPTHFPPFVRGRSGKMCISCDLKDYSSFSFSFSFCLFVADQARCAFPSRGWSNGLLSDSWHHAT